MKRLDVIDSHTGGEPTRVIVAGGPDLGTGPLSERRLRFRQEFDSIRSAVVNEPRGSDVHVGALLCEPVDPSCAAGVIFFNNTGVLQMCGHGTLGLVVTLAHMGRIVSGTHRIETPVGVVSTRLQGKNDVVLVNVPSFRERKGVSVQMGGEETITGDVAWGGNWFFLTDAGGRILTRDHADTLTSYTYRIREALVTSGITGRNGAEIDHVELFGPPHGEADSRNFVLCPGGAYDRSPCGTGTSAKLACLLEDGDLRPGERWRQESVVGSVFEAWMEEHEGQVLPHLRGQAFVNAESSLILDERDPFCMGIRV